MTRTCITIVSCIALLAGPAPAQQDDQSPQMDSEQISRTDLARRSNYAIQNGVKFLLSTQSNDGSWRGGNLQGDEAGMTALATLALLYCGESQQSPAIQKAIAFLKRVDAQGIRHATYSTGLRAAVYASLPEALRKRELDGDLRWLRQAVIDNGERRGMYTYNLDRGSGDYSNSQYGVLGIWYAAQAGLEVPKAYWQAVEEGWLAGRNPDGGWGYYPGGSSPSYASMTAAAAATLYITNDYLHANQAADLTRKVNNQPIEDAIEWLGANFSVSVNSGRMGAERGPLRGGRGDPQMRDLLGARFESDRYVHYMLFGYERVGEASGLTRFGEHEWFTEGADFLIRTQAYDGSWTGTIGPVGDTAYSLLFLSRGRAPIVAQKLEFGGRWNNRSRDLAAFAAFMRRATERHVNWQVASVYFTPAELRQAPLLYVASDRALKLTAEQEARLKGYIDQGGLLVCVNEGRANEFTQSIIALARRLYPMYEFRELPPSHLIYKANFSANPQTERIRGLSNGVRELMVLYPIGDMTWKWQAAGGGFDPRNTPYASLANLWLYATDRANPRLKGEDTWVQRNDGVTATRAATIARIIYRGNHDPEPGGWQRLAGIMHNYDQTDLKILEITDPAAADLAYFTATNAITLPQATRTALKRYIDVGGLLMLEAAGGSPEAAGSFDLLLRDFYPNVVIAPLPLDHPIYRAATMGGKDIEKVNYRRSPDLSPVHIPRLRGAKVDGKLVAIVSNEDISGALVGYNTAGLRGYTTPSATDLMRNIILWRISALK